MKIGTVVKVADNSGPCFIRIIKIFGSSSEGSTKIGSQIVGSVLSTHGRKKFTVNKGSLVRGICIRLADSICRKDGQRLKFQYPSVIISTRNGLPRGTKIFGPIPKELREKGYIRLVSLATIAI
jgi:large subunit ribosomal protein L14